MNVTLRRLPGLLAGIIFFSNLSLAVCPGGPHQTSLAGYALSPDATRIAAIATDGTLFWWNVANGKRTQLEECIKTSAWDSPILFSPDSKQLAVAIDGAVHLFDVPIGNVISQLTSLKLKGIYNIAFSADGRRLAAINEERAVVWDINKKAEIVCIPATARRNALALNRDGSLLALGTWSGIELWAVPAAKAVSKLADGMITESLLFTTQDQLIVALSATPLPPLPKQRFQKYKREISVWDSASGKKLKMFKADAYLNELRFGLTIGGHLLLATDFEDHLRAWDLDSGELKGTWETSSGYPSGDGKVLLREGGAPGQLELWEIGSPDEKARPFEYKSPLCAESFVDDEGNVKFDGLFIADGSSDEEQPFGSSSTHGYVAQDCTRVNITRLSFKTEERARQELKHEVDQAIEVLEKGPPKDEGQRVFLGERRVLRFPRRDSALGPFAIIWLDGSSLREITSSSLPVALAMEKQVMKKR